MTQTGRKGPSRDSHSAPRQHRYLLDQHGGFPLAYLPFVIELVDFLGFNNAG
jgi:hypothetical protein